MKLPIVVMSGALIATGIFGVWLINSAFLFPDPPPEPRLLIAHRGVAQDFDREGLANDTCTAERLLPSGHSFLENTIASMQAAFELGADVVELDVHLTADGHFAVFHDWTLDCRTDGRGRTRDATMAELRALDIGYGYTSDGGETFPFRGTGVGLMPDLAEVFSTFPEGVFLIDIKSNYEADGAALATLITETPGAHEKVWGVYGGPRAVRRFAEANLGIETFYRRQTIDCLTAYFLTGWTGRMPTACHNTTVYVPVNYAGLLWGWPDRFVYRLETVGSRVVLVGPFERGDAGSRGLDSLEMLAQIPPSYSGWVQTDAIEVIAPAARADDAARRDD